MDLDNFEFRPLTKGLGFDKTTENSEKKTSSTTAPQQDVAIDKTQFEMPEKAFVTYNDTPVSRSLKKMLDSLPPSVEFTEDKDRELKLKGPAKPQPEIKTPVYRPNIEPVAQPEQQKQFDVTLNNSLSQAFPKAEVNKKFYHQMVTPIAQYKEIPASLASAIIDFALILGLFSLFVVSLVAFTKVDLVMMLTNSQLSARTLFELGALYFGVTIFYFMLSRGLYGSSLGDWAFDVQLGTAEDRSHLMYPGQVLFRAMIIALTGFIILPLVSLGFGKDIAYYVSGLKLYSKQY